MLVKVGELNYILRIMKKRMSKKGTVNRMIGKFEELIPEEKSAVEFLKELREEEYD